MRHAQAGAVCARRFELMLQGDDLILHLLLEELAVLSLVIRRSAQLLLPENVVESHKR
jgi:hypothetical protein